MPFPENIDFDKIANVALGDLGWALHDWLSGQPRDEVAFMNRVTAILARRRRGCDVGVVTPVTVSAQVAVLHREGERQVDRFGSDLAITIHDNQTGYTKTAVFQIKKSLDYSLIVQKKQLEDALADRRIAERSFILAIDETRAGFRIAKTKDIHDKLPAIQNSLTQDCSNWSFVTNWLWRWLSCDEGPASDPRDRNSVEALLDRFIVGDQAWDSPWMRNPNIDIEPEFHPARVWMAFFFEHSGR